MSFFSMLGNGSLAVTKRSDAALKRYESANDPRAWTSDKAEKSKYILEIVKRKNAENSSEDNETAPGTAAVQNIETMSKGDLVNQIKNLQKEIKIKDVELDKIHSLFKHATKKLEEMEGIIKDTHSFENQLKESKTQLQKLKIEQLNKDEQLKLMKQEMDELRCQSTASVETEMAWNEIKNRAGMLDEVKKERNILKSQLCKMVGISDVLCKLKSRADEADEMEQEICRLKRELQRYGNGASGDNVAPKKRVGSSCKQCHKYGEDLARSESILETEQKKNIETEAERNFLRERCRAIDIMEAELIMYRTNYEEAECKVTKLKEMLIRSQGSDKEVRELKQQLETVESQLKEAERHAEELLNIVERLEMDLKEREIYIESITRRMQQEHEADAAKITRGSIVVPPGKVQSIVQKLSVEIPATNCKCGIDNCQCGNVSKRDSSSSKIGNSQPSKSSDVSSCNGSEDSLAIREKAEAECYRLQQELACDENRLLRCQNAALFKELQQLKRDMKEMTTVMNKVDEERNSNTCLEKELTELSCAERKEVEISQSNYRSSIAEKEGELCNARQTIQELSQKLKDEREKTDGLEKNLATACVELQDLRPLENIRECCKNLKEKLSFAEVNCKDRSREVRELQGECNEFCQENERLKKQICELQLELDEQRKYAKKLADQLCQRRNIKEKAGAAEPQEPNDNRETLRKCIKDLKKHYDTLKIEKMEMIQCYEKKLKALESDVETLKSIRNEPEKTCQCECNIYEPESLLLRKAVTKGLSSLQRDELIDLHNRIRCAMMKIKKLPRLDIKLPLDYYTKVADELRSNYNLSDSMMDLDDIPVKDDEVCSSKTLPPLLRTSRSAKAAQVKPRARSSDADKDKLARCVTFSRKKQTK